MARCSWRLSADRGGRRVEGSRALRSIHLVKPLARRIPPTSRAPRPNTIRKRRRSAGTGHEFATTAADTSRALSLQGT